MLHLRTRLDELRLRLWFVPAIFALAAIAIDEIRLAGAAQIQVTRCLGSMLDDLLSVAPPDRRPVLHRELRRLEAGIDRSFPNAADATIAAHSWRLER